MFKADSSKLYKGTIAFAGLVQACSLVEQVATQGHCDEDCYKCSIGSVFKTDASSVEDVFSGQVNFVPGLRMGMQLLHSMLEQNRPPQSNPLRYSLALLHLETKLRKNAALMEILSSRLQKTQSNLSHFDMTHERIIASLAHIYEDTLSTFKYRIQVSGNRLYLENPNNVHKIRALLLAGVRAAMLWRQVGGKRWDLMLHRRQMMEITQALSD